MNEADSAVRFHCQNCGQKIRVPQINAGKKGKCPKCKNIVVVPKPESISFVSQSADADLKVSPASPHIESALFDIKQNSEATAQPTAQQHIPDNTLEDLQKLEQRFGIEKTEPEPAPKRKLPWLIDIFLYPTSTSGLTVLGIIIIIPLLINVVVGLLGPFGFFVAIPGLVIKIVIGAYIYWYFAECIRDSAAGGLRAPETLATTPGVGDMALQLIKQVGCLAFFFAPVLIYFLYTRKIDAILWSLLAYAVFFFPMGLLAVILFDSFTGLNPLLLAGSILSTFFPYCGLILIFCATVLIAKSVPGIQKSLILVFILRCVRIYLTLVVAHLLGRFYWRYQEKLNWEV